MSSAYAEFNFRTAGAGNGRHGELLAQKIIELVRGLDGVESICDLGCGNGYLSGQLAALGYRVTGIDASETGIAIARHNYPNGKFVTSLIGKNLRDAIKVDNFDLVVSSDVIEHLYCPSDLVEAASSILKQNGQLIIGTPYHGYLKNLLLAASGKLDSHFDVLQDGGHIKFFSQKTLSLLLRNHFFTDLKFSFYGRAPWLWMNMICHARKKV